MQSNSAKQLETAASDVWVVIACFNDAQVIEQTIESVRQYGYSVVVVDDGSDFPLTLPPRFSDVHLCRHVINLGQGAALQTGIDYALLRGARFLVTFDADGQHQASDIERLILQLIRTRTEVALGSRFIDGGQAKGMPFNKFITLQWAVVFTRLLTGLPLTDTHNGLRALTADAARKIRITQNRMSHATEILQTISRERIPYTEVPVTITYTAYSIQKGQRLSNAFNILWESFSSMLLRLRVDK